MKRYMIAVNDYLLLKGSADRLSAFDIPSTSDESVDANPAVPVIHNSTNFR